MKLTWNQIYSEKELYRAALKIYTKPLFNSRKGLIRSTDDKTIYHFAQKTSLHVERLHKQLTSRTFKYRPAQKVVRNFNGKIREIFIYPWEEKIVDALLYSRLNECLQKEMSKNAYAYRHQDSGVDYCQYKVKKCLKEYIGTPLYIIRRDIKSYFPSINHEILISKIKTYVNENDYLFTLLKQRVECLYEEEQESLVSVEGVPFGTSIACFLANLNLIELDRAVESLGHYFRYADDFLFITSNKQKAQQAIEELDKQLLKLELTFNVKHHKQYCFDAALEGFETVNNFRFLGLSFCKDATAQLSKDKLRKICNIFRFTFNKARLPKKDAVTRIERLIHKANRVIEDGVRNVAIIDYYLKHTDNEQQIRLIDRWLAEEVLARGLQKGHKKGNFKLFSFQKLRELGLPSLLYRKRLLQHGHLKTSFLSLKEGR